MLDIKFIRENADKVRASVKNKNHNPQVVDNLLSTDEKRRDLIAKVEQIRSQRNELNDQLKKARTDELIQKSLMLKKQLDDLEPELKRTEEVFSDFMLRIPNIPLDEVPVGINEKDNVEVRKSGTIPKFSFTPKDHLEIGTSLGILDFESGAKVAGSQFYYLCGDGVLLELALIRFAMDILGKEGFKPVITPDLAKSRFYLGTGYMPKGNEAQTYTIEGHDLGLIATAEVTLAGKHADEVIPEDQLPLKYIGYSHCFRQEAGAYGKYSKGLYRVHQFTKAEMFVYCKPEESGKLHLYLLEMEEKIYQALGLPYRVLEMCTGDLGAMAARKFDIEVWMPGREDYGEVTSTSNCTDYQARNLNIKYKKKDGQNEYVHMLNGTAIPTSRAIVAILENYQQKDGSVKVPAVLVPYLGKEVLLPQ